MVFNNASKCFRACTRPIGYAVFALLVLAGAPTASASPVLDQAVSNAGSSYLFGTPPSSFWGQLGQTFTAGASGPLASVSLRLGRSDSDVSGSVTVQIRNSQAGVASTGTGFVASQIPGSPELSPFTGLILASTTIAAADLPLVDPSLQVAPFLDGIDFSVPVLLDAGEIYSLVLTGNGSSEFVWSTEVIGTYAGGSGFARIADGHAWSFAGAGPFISDFGFRTYVGAAISVPEPSSILLIGAGLAGAGLLARRKKRA